MKYKFEISIAEIKDLGPGPFEFKIALDSMEQNLYDTDTFEIYGEGNFALGILSNDELLGGFRIPMSSLHRVTSSWFPISNPYTELLSLPESVQTARVYLTILEISILSPVQEHREVSEYSLQSTPRVFSPEVSKIEEFDSQDIYTAQLSHLVEINRKEIFELRELYESAKKTIEKMMEEGNKREEELGKQINGIVEVNNQLEAENVRLGVENLKANVENQGLKGCLAEMKEEMNKVRELFRDSEQRKKDLQAFVGKTQKKMTELKSQCEEVTFLQTENQNLQFSVKSLNEKLKDYEKFKETEEKLNSTISVLNSSVSGLKLEIVELRKTNKFLTEENTHYKEIIDKSRASTTKQDYDSTDPPEQTKPAPIRISNTNREERLDSIDRALRDYMKESGLINPFNKIGEGVYQYGTKKISLSLKNGMPVIRVGGGYMFIDEFLKIYNGQIKKRPEEEVTERSMSLEGKIGKGLMEKFVEELDVENYPEMADMTPSESPMKKKIGGVAYPTKSAILKKIPRLATHHRELTPNSRRNRTPRQVFLP